MAEGGFTNFPKILNCRGFTEDDRETGITMKRFLKLEVESDRCKVEVRRIGAYLILCTESVGKELKWMEMCERGKKDWKEAKRELKAQDKHLNEVNEEGVEEIEYLKRENEELY